MVAIIENNKLPLFELCRKFMVKRLDLFGSATDDTFDPARSDIDFLVEFEPSTPSEHANRYFGLLSSLQDLFGRKIDLVEIRAIKNPYFKEDIEETRVILYGT